MISHLVPTTSGRPHRADLRWTLGHGPPDRPPEGTRMHRGSDRPAVFPITGARRSLTEDVHQREVRYLVSMGIRTACIVAAILVPYWPLRALFIVGGLVLPYIAVVMANAGRETAGEVRAVPPPARPELAAGASRPATDSRESHPHRSTHDGAA
jgi:hypothetical protein